MRHNPYAYRVASAPALPWAGRCYGKVRVPCLWPKFYKGVRRQSELPFTRDGINEIQAVINDYNLVCLCHFSDGVPIPQFADVVQLLLLLSGQPRLSASEMVEMNAEHTHHPLWDGELCRWRMSYEQWCGQHGIGVIEE